LVFYHLHLYNNPMPCSRYAAKTATRTDSIGL
jgi:hypothetical protein